MNGIDSFVVGHFGEVNKGFKQLICSLVKVAAESQEAGNILTPQLNKLDNEISQLMTTYMENEQIKNELIATSLRCRNLAERAIQIFQNHFISGLCSTHPDFPVNLWDKLLPQAELTLNLLRPSRIQLHLSAYAQLYGPFQ